MFITCILIVSPRNVDVLPVSFVFCHIQLFRFSQKTVIEADPEKIEKILHRKFRCSETIHVKISRETSSEAKAIKKLPIQYTSEFPQAPQFDMNKLEIAEGPNQLLLNKGRELNFLLQTEPKTLTHRLGIDEYVGSERN